MPLGPLGSHLHSSRVLLCAAFEIKRGTPPIAFLQLCVRGLSITLGSVLTHLRGNGAMLKWAKLHVTGAGTPARNQLDSSKGQRLH